MTTVNEILEHGDVHIKIDHISIVTYPRLLYLVSF